MLHIGCVPRSRFSGASQASALRITETPDRISHVRLSELSAKQTDQRDQPVREAGIE